MTQPQHVAPNPAPCPVKEPAGLGTEAQTRLDWLFRLPQAPHPAQDLKAMVWRYRQAHPK